jgi:ABC-type transporter Mla subunit MlaD
MKSSTRITRTLRVAAVALLLTGLGVWAATGARVGWTQTSAVTLHHDEITGIKYPVRHDTFIAGVEVPLLAAVAAAGLAALSLIPRRAQQRA